VGLDDAALRVFLKRHPKIGLDTSVFIYQVEENPVYIPWTDAILKWIESGNGSAVTSTITMLELLVQPYRDDSDDGRVDAYYALLSTYPHLEWAPASLEIADRAASLRAKFNLRTPDAIQAATAQKASATAFVSNDPVFRRVPDLEVLVLDDLRGKQAGQSKNPQRSE
jgi:predicted nucleic acid-binding protein